MVLAAAALAELQVSEPEKGASLQAPNPGAGLWTPPLYSSPPPGLTLPEALQPSGQPEESAPVKMKVAAPCPQPGLLQTDMPLGT